MTVLVSFTGDDDDDDDDDNRNDGENNTTTALRPIKVKILRNCYPGLRLSSVERCVP
jgi:hypothetical protein